MIKKFLKKLKDKKKSKDNTKYPNRFLKFYHLNKKRLIKERRSLYKRKRKAGVCVRCSQKVVPGIVFCSYHQKKQQVYNKNARS